MKRILEIWILITIGLLFTASLFAQSPEKMNYQALVRDAGNDLVTNQQVGMQISILQDSVNGTEVYRETHVPTTNAFGLVTLEIGSGTILSGSMAAIDWANGPFFIKTETDPAGGTNYIISGTSQLLSVPYALFAKTAGSAPGGGTVIQNDSLVLKDSMGVIRMVLNPNTGTFKMMNNDTVWYELSVQSPFLNKSLWENGWAQWTSFTSTQSGNGGYWEYTEIRDPTGTVMREINEGHQQLNPDSFTEFFETRQYAIDANTNQRYLESVKREDDISNNENSGKNYNEFIETTKIYGPNEEIINMTEQVEKYFKSGPDRGKKEITTTTYIRDDQGNLVVQNVDKVVINPDASSTDNKVFQSYLQGIIQGYLIVEEKNDPAAFEQTKTVSDTLGNGTSTKLSKNYLKFINSHPNAKGFEYTYSNNKTQLNFVDTAENKTNIAYLDALGGVNYGPNNAIKTNKLGETFTKNTYVAGDLLTTGNTDVYGNLNVSGTKNFRITHPNDTSKYLVHAAIESNEVLNVYSGNITTNKQGLATVSLPDYFDDINTDFRYMLTVVGHTFARAIVYQEIDAKNQFVIKTDQPEIKVSWQITAKRSDDYMKKNAFRDVIDK